MAGHAPDPFRPYSGADSFGPCPTGGRPLPTGSSMGGFFAAGACHPSRCPRSRSPLFFRDTRALPRGNLPATTGRSARHPSSEDSPSRPRGNAGPTASSVGDTPAVSTYHPREHALERRAIRDATRVGSSARRVPMVCPCVLFSRGPLGGSSLAGKPGSTASKARFLYWPTRSGHALCHHAALRPGGSRLGPGGSSTGSATATSRRLSGSAAVTTRDGRARGAGAAPGGAYFPTCVAGAQLPNGLTAGNGGRPRGRRPQTADPKHGVQGP